MKFSAKCFRLSYRIDRKAYFAAISAAKFAEKSVEENLFRASDSGLEFYKKEKDFSEEK